MLLCSALAVSVQNNVFVIAPDEDGVGFLAPNPAHDFTRLIIQNDEEARVQLAIVDVHGRLIRVKTVSLMKGYNQVYMDVSDLVPGVYEINLASPNRNRAFKLIKQ